MPYTVEDYKRELKEEVLASITLDELLKRLSPEERLKGLPPEERLKGLPPEEFLKRLTREQIEANLKSSRCRIKETSTYAKRRRARRCLRHFNFF